ncbi:MAG: SH3 domain-containing protein [Eubacteriales bacterium]|nr:SH3 domain-containing protein [Eubacteriales bacterium]
MKYRFLKEMGIFFSCVTLTAGMSAAAEPAKNGWEYTKAEKEGFIEYTFEEVNLKLPENWEGKLETKDEGDCIGFFHKDSMEAGNQDGEEGCGALFWLNCSKDYKFVENTSVYYLVGSGKKGVYYITVPGDLHGYQKDEAILNEWMEMSEKVEEIWKGADSRNPGAPMLTTDAVNFRDENNLESRVSEVIPQDAAVWVTGNLTDGWAQVNYNGKDGYVKADYLEFPDDISSCLLKEEEETDGNGIYDDNKETDGDAAGIARQRDDSAVMYNVYGEEVLISAASDGNWYDENGVYFGTDEEIREAGIRGTTVVNGNGEVYFWTVPKRDTPDSDIPYQGANGAMLYDGNGNGVLVQQADDGYWYDENGVCYGYWEEIQDAGITGAPITNENRETYYWTAQN